MRRAATVEEQQARVLALFWFALPAFILVQTIAQVLLDHPVEELVQGVATFGGLAACARYVRGPTSFWSLRPTWTHGLAVEARAAKTFNWLFIASSLAYLLLAFVAYLIVEAALGSGAVDAMNWVLLGGEILLLVGFTLAGGRRALAIAPA